MPTISSPAHRFLIQIAEDLSSGDVNFPTYLDAAMKIRKAMNKPDLTIDALSRVMVAEPLVSAKVIRLANSAALNPSGQDIADVGAPGNSLAGADTIGSILDESRDELNSIISALGR